MPSDFNAGDNPGPDQLIGGVAADVEHLNQVLDGYNIVVLIEHSESFPTHGKFQFVSSYYVSQINMVSVFLFICMRVYNL